MRGLEAAGTRCRLAALAIAAATFLLVAALSSFAAAQQPGPPNSQADQGRRLFTGETRMQNGGPPCGACHSAATVPFPNGGVLGPDLSGVYNMLGPEGTDVTLRTLFFPTMRPIYADRPLTPPEQQALKAFFQQANGVSGAQQATIVLASVAFLAFLVLLALTWLAWRGRLRGVRAPLVRRAVAGGIRP